MKIQPDKYGNCIIYENGVKTVYVAVLRAIYGMLVSALLWYKKFKSNLEEQGFKFNVYDPCMANKMIDGKQQTIRLHLDDLMSSHKDLKVNDNFLKWLNKKYGEHGKVQTTRGKKHDYLGMIFEFENGQVKINMIEYLKKMLQEFPNKFKQYETAIWETRLGTAMDYPSPRLTRTLAGCLDHCAWFTGERLTSRCADRCEQTFWISQEEMSI